MPANRKKIRPTKSRPWLIALGLIALTFPVCFPLFTSQLPSGHDTWSYHPRLVEFHENIRQGILLPRWAPDLEIGAGQPLFLFSPPLPYYAAEFWHLLGFDSVVSFNLLAITIVIASACSMFLFVDYQFGRDAAWLATAAYLYAPYFHIDIFVRHALAEFTSFPFYPLALYGFSRHSRERDLRFLAAGAAAWSAVILSHSPSALLFSPVLLTFVSFLAWKNHSFRLFGQMAGGILIGIALAAFIWAPMLEESKFVYIERSQQGKTHYVDHFVFPQQLWSGIWGYGLSVPGPDDQLSFSLGLGHVPLIAAAAWLIYSDKKRTLGSWCMFLLSGLVVLVFMMIPASQFLWDHLPLLQQVQFPWRLLGDICLLSALMAGLYGASLKDRHYSGLWFWAGIAFLIVPNLSHIGPQEYYSVVSSEWTPAAMAQRGVETTVMAEFEPRWVKERMEYTPDKARIVSGQGTVSAVERFPTAWKLETSLDRDALVEAALLYFPGWTVSVDGTETQVEIADSGRMRFRVPAGRHLVAIDFKRTRVRFVAEVLSLLTFVALIAGLLLT